MSTMKKRIPMFLIALVMMVAVALPAFALPTSGNSSDSNNTVAPCAAAHCEKNGHVGYYICIRSSTNKVGKEYRNCIHGRVGISDYREQYKLSGRYRCNLCASEYSTTDFYWGDWVCP